MFVGAEDRMLGPLVWVYLVMYRPVLVPDRPLTILVKAALTATRFSFRNASVGTSSRAAAAAAI
ncbi:hypothetical protein ACFQ1S_39565, partial [Kibdelosporangium lantanae]